MAALKTNTFLTTVSGLDWTGVDYFCTTRHGGVGNGAYAGLNLATHTLDDSQSVAENRRRLAALLPGPPLWLAQEHGTQVYDADGQTSLAAPIADAAVTTEKKRVLAVMTADCLPVVIADMQGGALGVAHAGWRGLVNGVLIETLRCLRAKQAQGRQWRAWIGPAISQRHFEVGDDVFSAFVNRDPSARVFFVEKQANEKWLADLPGLARHQLQQEGVRNIELSGHCTYAQDTDFYSFRRQPSTGRMATLAWLSD